MDTNTRQRTSTQEFERQPQQAAPQQAQQPQQPPAQQAHQNASRYSRNSARYKNGAQALRAMNAATAEGNRRAAAASARAAAAAEGKRARTGELDQNTAFGTQKNPEGFVQTWKSATHTWRWRVVLCVFLALLLVMMQPTGNALYRSWNAATGEAQGLGAAFATGEEEPKTDLVNAKLSDTPMVALEGEGDEGEAVTPISMPEDSVLKIQYFGSYKDALAGPVDWARKARDTSEYWLFWDEHTNSVEYAKDTDSVELGVPNNYNGQLGKLTWLREGEDGAAWNRTELWSESSTSSPGYYVWALGYNLKGWYTFLPKSLETIKTGYIATDDSLTSKSDTAFSGFSPEGNQLIAPLSVESEPYESSPSDQGRSFYTALDAGLSDGVNASKYVSANEHGQYYVIQAYAQWALREYHVKVCYWALNGDSLEEYQMQKGGDAEYSMKWSDAFTESLGQDFVSLLSNMGLTWDVYATNATNNIVGEPVLRGVSLNADSVLGNALNPTNDSSPDVDPASNSSAYVLKRGGSASRVAITPTISVTYKNEDGTETYGVDSYKVSLEMGDDNGYVAFVPLKEEGDSEDVEGEFIAIRPITDFVSSSTGFQGWATTQDGPVVVGPTATGSVLALKNEDNLIFDDYIRSYHGYDQETETETEDVYYDLVKSITLYAKFPSAKKYNVTWRLQDEAGNLLDDNGSVESTSPAKLANAAAQYAEKTPLSEITTPTDGSDPVTAIWSENTSVISSANFDAKYRGGSEDTDLATITWEYYETDSTKADGKGTEIKDPSTELTKPVTIVGTLHKATYDVTLKPGDGKFDETYGGADGIVVEDVPYGTQYSAITFDPVTKTVDGEETTTYVYKDEGAGSIKVTDVLTGGWGSLGTNPTAAPVVEGTTTWPGTWSGGNLTGNVENLPTSTEDNPLTEANGVTGDTTLTYTYQEGYNELKFVKNAEGASNANYPDDKIIADDTSLDADGKTRATAIQNSQKTSDVTLGYEIAYVPNSKWTYGDLLTYASWKKADGSAPTALPTYTQEDATIAAKYEKVHDDTVDGTGNTNKSGYISWSGLPVKPADDTTVTDATALPANTYTFTATPTLRTFDVKLEIAGTTGTDPINSGGYITRDSKNTYLGTDANDVSTAPSTPTTVGTVTYGDFADAAINATVIGTDATYKADGSVDQEPTGVVPSNTAGYIKEGATWKNSVDDATTAPSATQVTQAVTFTMTLAKRVFDVQVNVNGGTFEKLVPTDTEVTNSFTITGVPYNTAVKDISYGDDFKYSSGGTYRLAGPSTLTAGVGRSVEAQNGVQTASTWSSTIFSGTVGALNDAEGSGTKSKDGNIYSTGETNDKLAGVLHDLTGANALTYEFGRKIIPVKFVVKDDAGKWLSLGSSTLQGTVLFGKTLNEAVTAETLSQLPEPEKDNTTFSVNDTNHYFNPYDGTHAGTWTRNFSTLDATPTGNTVIKLTQAQLDTLTAENPVLYTYTLVTRDDLTVNYTIPTADDTNKEVQFAQTSSFENITYDTARSTAAPAPTSLKPVDGASETLIAKVAQKYKLEVSTWKTTEGANATLAEKVHEALTYVANVELNEYTVEYEIVNGSWITGEGRTSTDSNKYHYDDSPSATYAELTIPMATQAASGNTENTATNFVTPNDGYKTTANAWEGVWEKSVNLRTYNESTGTVTTAWTPYEEITGTPSQEKLNGDTKFRLTLKRVVKINFVFDETSISSGSFDSEKTGEYFAGNALSAPGVTLSNLTLTDDQKTLYQKTSGTDNRKGHWTTEVPAMVPTVANPADGKYEYTYTYALYPVHTATYNVIHGTWNGKTGDDATAAITEEAFECDDITFPKSSPTKANLYNADPTWHVTTQTGDTVTPGTPTSGITLTTDRTYYAVHEPIEGVTCKYTVRFWRQNTSLADEEYVTNGVVVENVTPGTEVTLDWNDSIITNHLPTSVGSDTDLNGFQANTTRSDVGSTKSKVIEGDDQEFNVYYGRKSFDVAYEYSFDAASGSTAYTKAYTGEGFPTTVPTTTQVVYGATLSPDATAATYAASNDYITFGGWKLNNETPTTMPAQNVTLTGAWTRNAATITLVNDAEGQQKGDISATVNDTTQINNISLTGYKYGDTIDWPTFTYQKKEGTNWFFGGWMYNVTNTNVGTTLAETVPTVDALDITLTATWNNGIRILYNPDANGVATFEAQDFGYKNPDSNGEVTVDQFTTADPETAHKPGYIFQGWQWDETDTSITVPNKQPWTVKPKTSVPLTFTAVYEGTPHAVTYDKNGGTQKDGVEGAPGTDANTGDSIYLPNGSNELTRTGCTLAGYEIKVNGVAVTDGATVDYADVVDGESVNKKLFAPGETWEVPAGTEALNYRDGIEITAKWNINVTFSIAESTPAEAGLSSTDVPTAIASANTTYASVPLGTTVTLPTVTEESVVKTIANATVADGYHFSGYTVSTTSPAIELTKSSTEFTIPSADNATFSAGGIAIEAAWAIDEYSVSWEKSDETVYNDVALTTDAGISTKFGNTGSSVQAGTAEDATGDTIATPKLKGVGESELETGKYSTDGVVWYLKIDGTQSKVKLTDITFGEPFYYNEDGVCESSDTNAQLFTWTDPAQEKNGKAVTFVAVPTIKQYDITLAVRNGTMAEPPSTDADKTSVVYKKDYDTSYETFIKSLADYHFTADGYHVQSSGEWVDGSSPYPGSGNWAHVTPPGATYIYSFPTLKSYTITYEIAAPGDDDPWKGDVTTKAQTETDSDSGVVLARYAETSHPDITTDDNNSRYNTATFPRLSNSGTWSATDVTNKYQSELEWHLKKTDGTVDSTVVTTGDYSDDIITEQKNDYPNHVVTFVGTPKTKNYTITVKVQGGTFKEDTDKNITAGTTEYEVTDSAVFDKTVDTYLPNPDNMFERDADNNMSTGHWECTTKGSDAIDTSTFKVGDAGADSAVYTYVFDEKATVTFRVNKVGDGGFASDTGVTEITDNGTTYYVKTYYVPKGGTLLDAADPAIKTSKTFANEAALQAAYKLNPQGSTQGYEWNKTVVDTTDVAKLRVAGWTTTLVNTLAATKANPDETTSETDVNYPSATATITGDVTFTYNYAPKPITVNFVQMFQTTDGTGYEKRNDADNNEHSSKWEGTYSTDDVTIANLDEVVLDGTDTTLKGFKINPVKATSDEGGNDAITTFQPIHFASDDTIYLWYDRIPVKILYSWANTDVVSVPDVTKPADVTTRWGAKETLDAVTDSTFEKALDGWYLSYNSSTKALSDRAAEPGKQYELKPTYTTENSTGNTVNVTLYGQWQTATYTVKYALESTGDENDAAAQFKLDSADAAATVTTDAITYNTALGEGNVPTIENSTAGQYQLNGWKLYNSAGGDITSTLTEETNGVVAKEVVTDELADPQVTANLILNDDLKNLKVREPGYELRPQFSLQVKTVELSGGQHADISDKPNTKFSVKYGTELALPTFSDDTHKWINANNYLVPYDEDFYVVHGSYVVNTPSAWVNTTTDETWPNAEGNKLTVTTDAVYEYQWTLYPYEVYFMGVDGAGCNIYELANVSPVISGVTWSENVFSAKMSGDSQNRTLLEYFGTYTEGAKNGQYKIANPSWDGHTFLGWRKGSATKASGSPLVTAGTDTIPVSLAYDADFSRQAQKVYLWATWEGDPAVITFHKNDKTYGVGETEPTATQNMNVLEASNLKKLFELEGFERPGYTFTGWSSAPTLPTGETALADGAEYTPAYDTSKYDEEGTARYDLYATWEPNTYYVQYAHFNGDLFTNAEVTGDTDDATKDKPYQDTFTFDSTETENLTSRITKTNFQNAGETKNPDSAGFAGWKYNPPTGSGNEAATYQPGAAVHNLTTEANGVVTLTPASTGKVTLTFSKNTEDNVSVPDAMKANKDETVNSVDGYAKFKMPEIEPVRAGYDFQGWKIEGAVDSAGTAIETAAKNTEVYLPGTSTSYVALAQWEAKQDVGYTILRMVQDGLNSSNYVLYAADKHDDKDGIAATGTTGQEITLTEAQVNASYAIPGYTYQPALSSPSITVAADGSSQIILKYNVKSISVTYAFSDATAGLPGKALEGSAAGTTPFGAESVVQLAGRGSHKLKEYTGSIPDGYHVLGTKSGETTDYAGKWHYTGVPAALLEVASTAVPAALDANTTYTVVDDAKLYLPLVKEQYTVTFKLGDNATWGDGSGTKGDTKPVTGVYYEDSVNFTTEGISTKAVVNGNQTYGFGGWVYQNLDDSTDPKNGKVVDPETTKTIGNTEYTASYFESYAVTWSAGGNSASGFGHTALANLQRKNLPVAYKWESETETERAGLVLADDDVDSRGVPLAADGYEFAGWKVTCAADIMLNDPETGTATTTAANGHTFTSLGELYEALPTGHDYFIEAQWNSVPQKVTFNSYANDGAQANTSTEMTGEPGSDKTTAPTAGDAKAPAAPANRPGFTFKYWQRDDDTAVQLNAGQAFTFPSKPAPAETSFTAVWEADTVEIKVATEGGLGSVDTNMTSMTIVANEADDYTLKANPKPGYRFVEWTVTPTETGVAAWSIDDWYDKANADKTSPTYGLLRLHQNDGLYQAATYTAVFAPETYQVTFENSYATQGKLTVEYAKINDAEVSYEEVNYLGKVKNTTFKAEGIEPGYSFEGWSYKYYKDIEQPDGTVVKSPTATEVDTRLTDAQVKELLVRGDTVFTAHYKKNAASVKFDANAPEGATITGSIGEKTGLETGQEITLPSSGYTWAGHTLLGWVTVDDKGNKPTVSSMTTAEWNAYPYKAGKAGDTYAVKGGEETLYAIYSAIEVTLVYDNNVKDADVTADLAVKASEPKSVHAGEAATALTVEAVGWSGGDKATQPGYVTDDAAALKIPGAAREFVGWSFDASVDPAAPAASRAAIFKAGDSIPAGYLPSGASNDEANQKVTIYAIWQDKTFDLYLLPNGGDLIPGKDAPEWPYKKNVKYGDTVTIPDLMYTHGNDYYFRYWLADDDANHPTRVSNSSGSADTYTFIGTDDVYLTATWQAKSTAKPVAVVQLMDEANHPLTDQVMGGYLLSDKPLSDSTYEKLTTVPDDEGKYSGKKTKDTSDYFTFLGWHVYSPFGTDTAIANWNDATVQGIIMMYDGRHGLPVYFSNNRNTDLFENNAYTDNKLTLYAEKKLKAYDVEFEANVPSTDASGEATGYTDAVAGTLATLEKVPVAGADKTIDAPPAEQDVKGYKFLGWLTDAPATQHATMTKDAFDSLVSNGKAITAGYDLSSPSAALLGENSTAYTKTLYGAWANTYSTIEFVSAYAGDGVRETGADTVMTENAKKDLTWKATIGAVTEPEKHPDDSAELSTTAFTGWQTENGVAIPATGSTKTIEQLTVADIVEADPSLQPDENGAYHIKLKAVWSSTVARVVYENDDADATGEVPGSVAIKLSETETPANTYTVLANTLQKVGYHANGWVGRGNDLTYNNTANAYNRGYNETAGWAMDFDKDAAGKSVTLYPAFTANTYTVKYVYAGEEGKANLPDSYKSLVTPTAVAGTDGTNAVTQHTAGWNTDSVYPSNLFATQPVLEGYDLTGWEYVTPKNNKITVEKDWTVEQLVAKAIEADGETDELKALRYADSTINLKPVWTAQTFTIKYDSDGGVLFSTSREPADKNGIAWNASVDSAGDALIIGSDKIHRDGFSQLEWKVGDKTGNKLENAGASGSQPTVQQLVELYHKALGEESADATKVVKDELTLYANWVEDQVSITFDVSDGRNGWIASAPSGANGATQTYTANEKTEVTYRVGAITGKVSRIDDTDVTGSLNIADVNVSVATSDGFSVTGWAFDGTSVGTMADPASYGLSKTYTTDGSGHNYNGNKAYVGGTFEAQVEGQADVAITVKYHDQKADGSGYDETTDSRSLKSSDFYNADGGKARVGDVIPALRQGEIRQSVPAGLVLDTSQLADYRVQAGADNVIDLYYNRAAVNVKFAWAWPVGSESATPPNLEPTRLAQLYGSTQNVPAAPTAPEGYEFVGYTLNGASLAAGGTFTLESLTDVTVVGTFKKAEYDVTLKGVYDEEGNARSGVGVPTASTALTVKVEKGGTLGDAKKIVLHDNQGKVKDVTLGKQTGTVDFSVDYNSDEFDITWMYKVGDTWRTTSDPTKVEINQATEFLAVASGAQMISYLTGDHGAFATTKAEGTRVEDVPAGYNMADYLYTMSNELKEKSGPTEADSDSPNYGMPTGDAGWRFAGWKWEYANAAGYMVADATPDAVVNADAVNPERLMNAGVEDVKNLQHGIQLTAQWVPTESYLKFDKNDEAAVTNAQNGRVYANWASGDPSGLKPTFDGTNAVPLPDAEQLTRDGFVLSKWEWTTTDANGDPVTYQYEPGASFQMPGSDKRTAGDPAVTLKAVWTEEYVTLEYISNDNAKGTVGASETVGAWSGEVLNSSPVKTVAGSTAVPAEHFHFVQWSEGSQDAAAITVGVGGSDESYKLTPQRSAGGRYVNAKYYATFVGDEVEVTFVMADAWKTFGAITVDGVTAANEAATLQMVPYNDSPDMSKTAAVANEPGKYTLADGRYWDIYETTDNGATWKKVGTTADPSKERVTAKTRFAANLKENTGKYPVFFDEDTAFTTFESVLKAWGDTNVGAGRVPQRPGYDFNGWWVDPRNEPPASAATKGGAAGYLAEPGRYPAVSYSYGFLAGGDAYESVAQTAGILLKAGWKEKSGYALTFSANGGTFDQNDKFNTTDTTRVASDLKWTAKVSGLVGVEPQRPGYKFAGWALSSSPDAKAIGSAATYADLAGSNDTAPGGITLYAKWDEVKYPVKYVNYPLDSSDWITNPPEQAAEMIRYVKYSEVVASDAPYNWKTDDRVWDTWMVCTDGTGTPNKKLNDSSAPDSMNWTIADFEKNNVYAESDGTYVVYATWTNYIEWTTKFVLYDYKPTPATGEDAPTAAQLQEALGDTFQNVDAKKYLQVVRKGLPGDEVSPADLISEISVPGFTFDEDLTKWHNNGTAIGDLKQTLAAGTTPTDFEIAFYAKEGYSLAFDLNDNNMTLPGGEVLASVGDGVTGGAYPTQTVKDFYRQDNMPFAVDEDGEPIEDSPLGEPTRPGFTFGGWHSLQILDDAEASPQYDIESNNTIYYGDLAFDKEGNWYDPMYPPYNGVLTLFARWIEIPRTVRYVVASDMTGLVEIRLNSETDSDYSSAPREEVIGAATGDLFVRNGSGDYVRVSDGEQGAIAQAKRGYSFGGWRVVDDALPSGVTYDMPLGPGDPDAAATTSAAVAAVLESASMVSAAVAADEGMAAMAAAAVADGGSAVSAVAMAMAAAEADGAAMSAAAAEDDGEGAVMTAAAGESQASTAGISYRPEASITPGTRTDTHLFGGMTATSASDPSASNVTYVATAKKNADAKITFDPGEGAYSGPASMTQPWGTYVGESEPWGSGEGYLPAADTLTRPGYTFQGWIIPAGTEYVVIDADGTSHTETFAVDTPVMPTNPIAKRIIVPEGGFTLKAAWAEAPAGATYEVTVPETTLADGTVIPGITLQVPEGGKLTDEQIEQIINRQGVTPDKWLVTYYDPKTGAWVVDKEVTTEQLRELLRTLEIDGPVTIKPAADAKADPYVPPKTEDPKAPWTRPAKDRAAKTGENALIAVGASVAIVTAILALAVLLFTRRRQS